MPDTSKSNPLAESEARKIFAEFASVFPSAADVGLWMDGIDKWAANKPGPNPLADAGLGSCCECEAFLLPPSSKPIDAMVAWFKGHGTQLESAIKDLVRLVESPPLTVEASGPINMPAGLFPLLSGAMEFLKEQNKLCGNNPKTNQSFDQVFAVLKEQSALASSKLSGEAKVSNQKG